MTTWRRKAASSEEFQILAGTNSQLQAEKLRLEKDNGDLKLANGQLEQKVKALQVAVSILLASSVGLSIGLATSMTGATPQAALTSATTAFLTVITVSIAIWAFMRQDRRSSN